MKQARWVLYVLAAVLIYIGLVKFGFSVRDYFIDDRINELVKEKCLK